MFSSSGIIKYDPVSKAGRLQPWWMIVNCDKEFKDYYGWFIRKERFEKVATSVWGVHITVIRGEKPINQELWGKHEGMQIPFQYWGELNTNGCHWWMEIHSPELSHIREDLGLNREPPAPLHMTFGRVTQRNC